MNHRLHYRQPERRAHSSCRVRTLHPVYRPGLRPQCRFQVYLFFSHAVVYVCERLCELQAGYKMADGAETFQAADHTLFGMGGG